MVKNRAKPDASRCHEAIREQRRLAGRVISADRLGAVSRVAGVDVGPVAAHPERLRAAVAVLGFPSLEVVESATATFEPTFPYVPGLLSFRELPGLLEAFAALRTRPDLILVDGQGYAHPRRFGLACHLGVTLDIPSIGVGKTRLTGTFTPPGEARGDWTPLCDRGESIGAVVRTRTGCLPLYVSVGHRVSLDSAVHYTLACTRRYKLPETTRQAHRLASRDSRR